MHVFSTVNGQAAIQLENPGNPCELFQQDPEGTIVQSACLEIFLRLVNAIRHYP